ncbi:MAG: hypothetical protein J0L84_07530 [Verrucomicrobia bacterium]|nr:hypothetical protein [Verrucomicrobiota bacterium]
MLALVVAAGTVALAQQAVPIQAPVVVGRAGVGIQNAPPTDTIRFDLDFPGGTVVEFVEAVSKARGTLVNVLIPEELKLVMIPEMKMSQVDARSLLQATSTALARTKRRAQSVPGGSTFYERQSVGYTFQPVAEGVWTFATVGDSDDERPAAQSVVFFSLEPYLGQYSIDDIITVIEAGNQLRPNTKPLSLKFHKETQLLVVRGTPEDLNIVKGALSELRPGVKGPQPPADAPVPAQPK